MPTQEQLEACVKDAWSQYETARDALAANEAQGSATAAERGEVRRLLKNYQTYETMLRVRSPRGERQQ